MTEELFEWFSPCWNKAFTWDMVAWLGQISRGDLERLLPFVSTNAGEPDTRREGYFPPFVHNGEACIFGPLTIRYMMGSRNILYTCLKRDPDHFDRVLSAHLEPHLIAVARDQLNTMTGMHLASTVTWEGGELDLLAYRPSENAVLVVEAKAAVAPEGARMVARMEGRALEGLSQLSKFLELDQERRDDTLSRAFGKRLRNVRGDTHRVRWNDKHDGRW